MMNPTMRQGYTIHKAVIDLFLRQDQILLYYKGIVKRIKGQSHDGRIMDLPFDIFIKHISEEGLSGTFEITYTSGAGFAGKLVQLRRLS